MAVTTTPYIERRLRRPRVNGFLLSTLIAALCVALPMAVVVGFVFVGGSEAWAHLVDTLLVRYAWNSLMLSFLVALGVIAIGVPAAWMIAFYRFPGRDLFSWLLLLPLAYPAYILAYAYTGVLDYSGPVLTWMRAIDAPAWMMSPFLNLKSLPGAALMLSLVLYPYVYLMARAAFLDQSANLMEAAYTLGQSRWSVFRRVVIPMARPAIVAGTLLALMETLADFGTVQYFGVQTFTTGIVRTYYGFGDTVGAAQLSSVLLGFVFVLIVVERLSRHRVQYYSDRLRQLNQASVQLRGRKAFWMQCLCAIPVCFGFVLPTTLLLYWSVFFAELESLWGVMANSFLLAGGSAILIVTLALMVAYANRLHPSRWLTYLTLLVGLGYALPGVVIAMGVLIPFSAMDQWISAQLAPFGVPPSLYFSGTVFALVFAYVVRFLAVANGTIFSGLSRIRPSLDHSGRLLGLTQTGVLRSIHVPLMRGSVLTAALVCFVDILKELPATLMLRPFNFDTLAVKTYALASEERLIDAAAPALLIVVVGLLPVIWLNRSVSKE